MTAMLLAISAICAMFSRSISCPFHALDYLPASSA
jgi:hypothetical protein